jgi:hypothetical protein
VTTELKSPSMADHEFYSDVLGGEDDDDDPDDMMSKIKTYDLGEGCESDTE